MKELIDDIKTRLQGVTELKYIDEDWGQLDYYSAAPPVKFPCALIDIDNVRWSDEGNQTQIGIANVVVRLANMRLSNSNVKAPAGQKAKSLSFFDTVMHIHQKLHTWSGAKNNGPLTRIGYRKVKRDDGIREIEMIFAVEITDDSARKVYSKKMIQAAGLQITVEDM
jgi:hypothetical protein